MNATEAEVDTKALLDRVEAATGGSRELDAAIICAFPELPVKMTPDDRWPGRVTFEHAPGDFDSRRAPPYSYSIDAALALTERLGLTVHTVHHGHSMWSVDVCVPNNAMLANEGNAPTFPLAIILATLRAYAALSSERREGP